MSDRAAKEHTFHLLLEEARAELLHQFYENWNDLNQSEQIEVSRLLNFFLWFTLTSLFCRSCKNQRKLEEQEKDRIKRLEGYNIIWSLAIG